MVKSFFGESFFTGAESKQSATFGKPGADMKIRPSLILALLVLFPALSWADGSPASEWTAQGQPRPTVTPNTASDASFDPRLPPVLPGETVNDSGRKMKVWSTTGPVPVSTAPEPWRNNHEEVLHHDTHGGVGVIVDTRDGERRK